MRLSSSQLPGDGPQLRLLRAEDLGSHDGTALSPQMTLPQFYRSWFRPVVLEDERDAAESTIILWDRSVAWWEEKSGNPPINQTDERTLANFRKQMRSATYTRAKVGGKHYDVKAITAKRIEQHVQSILARAQAKHLIAEAPRLIIRRVRTRKKPGFTPDQLRSIFETTPKMRRPENLQPSTSEFLRGLLAFALISGVRKGTFFALQWSWWVQRPDGWWVDFPDHSVPKTDRGVCVAIPEWLRVFLFRWPRQSERVFHNGWSLSHWDDCHVELQLAAGIERPLPFQAWRVTLGEEMVRSGAAFGLKMAQAGLDHRELSTTEDFYAGSANLFRRNYPPLFYVPPDDGQRRLFD